MATQFFPLTPQGLGTEDIEALDSYVLRLATEHGVSECQFHRLLAWWWNQAKSDDQPSLGRHVTYVSKIGYGRDVDALVQALEQGTGMTGLSSLTLAAFRDVCGVHVGSFGRGVHYWCPACLREQMRQGLPIYEKLAWRLKVISRCTTHKIALESSCPWCKRNQLRHVDTWPQCSACGKSLVGSEHLWRPALRPPDGETDVLEIIKYCADHPGTVFNRDAARKFWKLMREDKALGCHPGYEYFHLRPDPTRTLIPVLLRFAREFNIPLLSILLNPKQASAIRPLLPIEPAPDRRDHRDRRMTVSHRKELERTLKQYVETCNTSKSLKKLCEPYPCTTTVARYWFPDLVQAIADRNRELKRGISEKHKQSLKQLSLDLGLVLKAGEVGWHRVEIDLSAKYQVPLHRVRKRLSVLKKGAGSLE
jgi:hypothetical protein